MMKPAAGGFCARGVKRGAPFLDVLDFSFLINNERGTVGDPELRDEDAVIFGDLPFGEITQQRIRQVVLRGKLLLGRREVFADGEHLGVGAFKFGDTSLVRQHFLRSTTGKRGWKESQDNNVLTPEIGEFYFLPVRRGKREIGRHIADLQVSLRRRDLPCHSSRQGSGQQHSRQRFHVIPP